MSQELQQNRYDQLIRRVGGLIGGGSKVSEVLGELFPTIDVENIPPELLLLAQTRIGIGSLSLVAAAGEFARIQLFNPVDSGLLITVRRCLAGVTTGQRLRWARTNIALGTGQGTEINRDTRTLVTVRPTGQIRSASDAAATDQNGAADILGNTPLEIVDKDSAFVLSPGNGFEVGGGTVALRLTVTFWWQERVGEASELNL